MTDKSIAYELSLSPQTNSSVGTAGDKGDIHPPASQAGGTTNVIVPPRKMNKNKKLLKILRNLCEIRLFFEKFPKPGRLRRNSGMIFGFSWRMGLAPSKNIVFTVVFVPFFIYLAEIVPPALKTVPTLLCPPLLDLSINF